MTNHQEHWNFVTCELCRYTYSTGTGTSTVSVISFLFFYFKISYQGLPCLSCNVCPEIFYIQKFCLQKHETISLL
jgi:hypothetical protein